jgi:hypothetical protein
MRAIRNLGIFLAVFGLAAGALRAADVSVEFGFGASLSVPAFSTSYRNQFTPPMTPAANALSSSASQTVRLNGEPSVAITGLFNLMFDEHWGLQFLFDSFRPGFGGTNDPLDVNLTYYLTDPADIYAFSKQYPYPDSKGDYSETTYSLNGIYRLPLSESVALYFAGGFSAFHLTSAQAQPMGFASFRLETDPEPLLYIKTYQLVYDLGTRTLYGGNLGGELAFQVLRIMLLSLDVRYYFCPKADFTMHIREDAGLTDPVGPIEEALNLRPLSVDPSYLRLCFAIRFKF